MAEPWSDPARVQRLRDLWAEGISSTEIGRLLGVTKSAVVGKVGRLGLPLRAKPRTVSARIAGDSRGAWADAFYSQDRLALARRLAAERRRPEHVLALLNALPGKPIASVGSLLHGLARRGIKLHGSAPRTERRNPAGARKRAASGEGATMGAKPIGNPPPRATAAGGGQGSHETHLGVAPAGSTQAASAARGGGQRDRETQPARAPSPTHPSRTCEFPLWPDRGRVPRPPLFCGRPVRMKLSPRGDMVPCSYCPEHAKICFTTISIQAAA